MKLLKVQIELVHGLSISEVNAFWDDYLSQAIERNSLQYGGLNNGFAEPDGNFEINNTHKESVSVWLANRKK